MVRSVFASAALLASFAMVGLVERPAVAQSPVARVTDIVVESVEFVGGKLIANALVTLDVAGQELEQPVQIPLDLGGTAGPGECDILNLAVGPVKLDVLGLVVELDDCSNGPVTVDITGQEGQLLGDLLCGIAGDLLGGINLGDLLGDLTDAELLALTTALEDILNDLFDGILAESPAAAAQHAGGGGQRCDILTLEIPEGLELNVLGLNIETSPICLDVYAQRGRSNLLGNLLCNVTRLLDRGSRGNAVNALLRNIRRLVDRL